jgi:hypothetical protein
MRDSNLILLQSFRLLTRKKSRNPASLLTLTNNPPLPPYHPKTIQFPPISQFEVPQECPKIRPSWQ